MAEVLLFHHACGQTAGFEAFADQLRGAGHMVHTPDLFDGATFATIEAGMAHAEAVGFPGAILARATEVAKVLPAELVYAGFSLGVVPAEFLAQTRAGARGALLYYSCVPPEALGAPWPTGLPAQIHGMDSDPLFTEEGDLDAAQDLAASEPSVELFLYPGDQHYFADSSLPSYRKEPAELLVARTLAGLDAWS